MTLRSADFESAASASSAIPAWGGNPPSKYRTMLTLTASAMGMALTAIARVRGRNAASAIAVQMEHPESDSLLSTPSAARER